ncbi:thiol reductant ABC exporter subunit CydD [Maribrevibacterium harenarium]|uniref:Thiol reductant ABC exporter subunit CydD n=1 Tax=Maribrevibacterium harenarium TaxID=2589817 RepID=A0A501WT58_9GAMM|nr:thiol reductant ABC exporter subunit CydD [Maribrevibacterium harenarium]TPE51555.1 thiol reductant ABC exporter subunit CydD [Maribrevibacterium harenarium]
MPKSPTKGRAQRAPLSPEKTFLNLLATDQQSTFRRVHLLGLLQSVSIMLQALGFSLLLAHLVLHQSLDLFGSGLAITGFVLRYLCQWGRELLSAKASREIRFPLRQRLVSKLAHLGPQRHRLDEDAGLSTRIYEQVDALDDYFARYLPQTVMVVLIPAVLLIATALVSWIAFFIFLFTAPLVIFFMILVGHKAAQANRKQFAVLALLSNQFLDLSRGLSELKRLGAVDQGRERLEFSADAYRKSTMSVLRLAFLSTATLELFASVAIAMVALYLGLGLVEQLPWAQGNTPVPLQPAFFLLLMAPEFYLPLRQLGNDYHAKQKAEAAASQLLAIDSAQLSSATKQALAVSSQTDNARVYFNAVTWTQDGRVRLEQVTQKIAAGQRVWLRGPSGAGKSSLMALLLGFEQPTQGQIYIDGEILDAQQLPNWRKRLAWLPQQAEWIQGTIRANLLLGLPSVDETAINRALVLSGCDEFIRRLPLGLDSQLTELGAGVSGGQLQRIAIARALLSDADVWLLDEPCASLDPETAEALLNTLDEVTQGKTLLIISHDTHPVVWADAYWIMKGGELYVETPDKCAFF